MEIAWKKQLGLYLYGYPGGGNSIHDRYEITIPPTFVERLTGNGYLRSKTWRLTYCGNIIGDCASEAAAKAEARAHLARTSIKIAPPSARRLVGRRAS